MDMHAENSILVGNVRIFDHHLVRLGWMMPLVTVVGAMAVHWLNGNYRAVPFFISESDYPGIERWIFTLGLALTGVVLCTIAHRFNVRFKHRKASRFHRVSQVSGWLTGGAVMLLSFTDMYDHLTLHTITAAVVFGSGLVWGVSTHFLIGSSSPGIGMRKVGLSMAISGMTVLNTVIGYYLLTWDAGFLDTDSIVTTLNKIQPAINVAAPGEYLLFLGLVLCMASFERDMYAVEPQSEE